MIYVGKASNLRQRLSNYFQSPRNMHPRTAQMVATAESVEWTTVRNEVEALMLEFSLIKQHNPRFNVRLRDDKSYPFLAVTVDDEWPRALVMRGRKRKGTRYFGPVRARLRDPRHPRPAVAAASRSAPAARPSSTSTSVSAGRACCSTSRSAPARASARSTRWRIASWSTSCARSSTATPTTSSSASSARCRRRRPTLEFERAARLRDRLAAVRKAIEKQQMVGDRSEDIDVIGIAEDELEAAVQVFYVRKGRVLGRKGFILDKVEELTPGGLIDRILEAMYGDEPILGVPKQVLVPWEAEGVATYEEWLSMLPRVDGCRCGCRSVATSVALLETVTRNAKEEFTRHRLRRASDHNTRSRALTELQDHLGLPEAPLRIECYDMAHIQGTDYVGSMVVLEDGLPNKREYRRFKIRDVPGNDDYAAMAEVVRRRLQAYLDERDRPINERGDKPGKFAYPPQLLLVDGGKGQLSAAKRVIDELELTDEIPVAGPGEAVRGGLHPRAVRAGGDPAGERGAVHAAARPRRGAPIRQHVPRRTAQQADDHERARRHPRARRGAARRSW